MQTEHSIAIDSLQGGILPHHRAQLHASGISDAVIAARLYMSVLATSDARLLRCRGFSRAQCAQIPGLLMPLWGLDGKELENPGYESKLPTDDPTYLAQYRPDVPRLGQDGRVIKYELPPKCGARLDSNPAGRTLLLDPALPLWITEGVKKSDALISHGIPAITLLGVAMWRSLADWPLLMSLVKRREVVICFDSDVATNPHVARQERLLAQQLLQRGAQVRLARLVPDENGVKVGIDDFLSRGGQIGDIPMIDVAPEPPRGGMRAEEHPWMKALVTSEKGKVLENMHNYRLIARHHEAFGARVAYDTLAEQALYDGEPLTDGLLYDLTAPLAKDFDIGGTKDRVFRGALLAEAMTHPFDPIQDFLAALPPHDGYCRLSTWLCRITGASPSPYHEWVGQMLLCSLVARGMAPGSIQRYVVILEGEEATGKSHLVYAIGQPWSRELLVGLEAQAAKELIRGVWVAEMPELDALSRVEATRIKAFISTREDSWRRLYSNDIIVSPRRTTFIGTTNSTCYLTGQEGNTRFLPVRTRGRILVKAFESERLQLLAEAKARVLGAKPWWEEPRGINAAGEREERRIPSVYEERFSEYISHRMDDAPDYITREELFTRALHIVDQDGNPQPERWKDQNLQRQMSAAMHALGWVSAIKKIHGKTLRLYVQGTDEDPVPF